ncbi:hypothetical protein [Nocardioides pakistanensis]
MTSHLRHTAPGVVLTALLGAFTGGEHPVGWALVFAATAVTFLLLRFRTAR